jgi:DNA-binding transcriptional MerR regulator
MKYLIHDASELVGISRQTILYYEKTGAISNSRDEATGYRFFSPLDMSILMRARMYHAYGLNLKDVAGMIHKKTLQDIIAVFHSRETAMEKEIEWMRYQRLHLQRYITQLEEADASVGCIRFTERPGLFCLLCRNNQSITRNKRLRKYVKKWMEYMPIPQPLVVCNTHEKIDYDLGFCLTSEDAKQLNITADASVFYLEPIPCVYSVARVYTDLEMFHEYLPGFIKQMEQEGVAISGPVYGRVLISMNNPKGNFKYIEFWTPYKKIN